MGVNCIETCSNFDSRVIRKTDGKNLEEKPEESRREPKDCKQASTITLVT